MERAYDHAKRHVHELERNPRRVQNDKSCVGRLPDELWLEVFLQGSQNTDRPRFYDDLDCTGFLLSVTSTCSHWRKIARDCQSLWLIVPFHSRGPNDRPSLYFLRDRLGLSTVPNLMVKMSFSDYSTPRSYVENAIRSLVPHSHRCQELHIGVYPKFSINVLPIPGTFQCLRRLDIELDPLGGFNPPDDPISLLQNGSECSLESLRLVTDCLPIRLDDLPTAKLRSVSVNDITKVHLFWSFIMRCPVLETLRVEKQHVHDIIPHSIQADRLRSLYTNFPMHCFQALSAPAVRHIRYADGYLGLNDPTIIASIDLSFLSQYRSLRSLHLTVLTVQILWANVPKSNLVGISLPIWAAASMFEWLNVPSNRSLFPHKKTHNRIELSHGNFLDAVWRFHR